MDFPVAPPVRRRLIEVVEQSDLGYPNWLDGTPLRAAFVNRMANRYDWHPDPEAVREQTDLIQALQLILRLSTSPDDSVLIQTPNYPPFLATIRAMGLHTISVPFRDTANGWTPDFDVLERTVERHRPKVFVLVNPHNPTGRVLTHTELSRIAAVAAEFNLLVISDEIHAELTYTPHRHIPLASLSDDAASRTVTITSAGKAFNIAGLRCAVTHYGPTWLLDRRDSEPPDLYGAISVLSVAATLAAWEYGENWQETLLRVLDRNRRRVGETLNTMVPDARHHLPQASYLSWIDLSALRLDDPAGQILRDGNVMLDGGTPFGQTSSNFVRINFATSNSVLNRILDGIAHALTSRP
jgi:cystathionine beta-lyase